MKRLLAALAIGLGACAPANAGAQFVPHAARIVMQDTDGRPMPHPFLGGFDVPRPQLVDIDGDGDLDLFVQERSGEIILFERVGEAWTWRTDRFHDLDVGEWYRFVDLDGDGDADLLGEARFGYIKAWRNTGSRTTPHFAVASDSLRDSDGTPIFADRQNILNVVDIDCNGRLDLFLGRVTGTIDRYEQDGASADGFPRFRLLTERWEGIEIVGQVPGSPGIIPERPSMHGANTMAFGDIDADGDLDLLWGDFFEPGLLLIPNTGSCQHPSLRNSPQRFPTGNPLNTTGYNAPAVGDINGDGELDVVIGVIGGAYTPSQSGVNNLYVLEQVAPGKFEVRTSRMIPTVDVGSESMPLLADLDGDGDLDLLIGNKISPVDITSAEMILFENVGTRTAPVLRERGPIGIRGEFHYAPAVADLDGDGVPELVVGTWRDRVMLYRNTGTLAAPTWTLADSGLVVITRGSNTAPTLGDLDGDGDLDMLVGEASGALNLYRNTGTRTAPKFELVSDTFQGIDVGRRSTPHLVDLDGDGTLELLIGSEDGTIQVWRNATRDGEIRFVLDPAIRMTADAYSSVASGDLDGDGVIDLLVGTVAGGLRLIGALETAGSAKP